MKGRSGRKWRRRKKEEEKRGGAGEEGGFERCFQKALGRDGRCTKLVSYGVQSPVIIYFVYVYTRYTVAV